MEVLYGEEQHNTKTQDTCKINICSTISSEVKLNHGVIPSYQFCC